MDLAGRVVLLTGATGGIGRCLVDRLVQTNARVMAVGRDAVRLAELAEKHPNGKVVPLCFDLAEAEARKQLMAIARAMQPAPSILLMAHAQSSFTLFDEQSEADMQRLVGINLLAPMLLVRGMLPILERHPQSAVVAVGSTFGSLAFPGFATYSATKHGLRGLMEALAREHADGPVRFQYLSPRATRTPFNTPAVNALNEALKAAQDAPTDVAAALVAAIQRGDARLQIGWPEKFFVRLNSLLPGLVDRSLKSQLPVVKRHAQSSLSSTEETPDGHATHS